MIEVTEEIQRAYAETWYREFGLDEEQVQRMVAVELADPMPWRIAALRAVLAVATRDRCPAPAGHVHHPLAKPQSAAGPFGPVVNPCRNCGCAKSWHLKNGCSGDFTHCPCLMWVPGTPSNQERTGTETHPGGDPR